MKNIFLSIILIGLVLAVPIAYVVGADSAMRFGYEQGLSDFQLGLDKNGIYSNWVANPDGTYTINFLDANGGYINSATYKMDMVLQHIRSGRILSQSAHALTWTTYGLNWLSEKIWYSGGTNVTKFAMYMGCSAQTDTFSAAWTQLPTEITANGLGRALMTWTDTGSGTGNLTVTFNVSGTQSTQLYGLYHETYANSPYTLVAAEQQGAGAVKNLVSGDTLAATIMCTAAGA